MIYLNSTNLLAMEYKEDTKELWVAFKGRPNEIKPTEFYVYSEVPDEVWEGFKIVESKGSFFHKNVKGRYKFRKESI